MGGPHVYFTRHAQAFTGLVESSVKVFTDLQAKCITLVSLCFSGVSKQSLPRAVLEDSGIWQQKTTEIPATGNVNVCLFGCVGHFGSFPHENHETAESPIFSQEI